MKPYLFLFIAFIGFGCSQKTNEVPANSVQEKSIIANVRPDQLIVPGTAIGSTAIDDDASELESLGQPDESDAAMGKAWMTWYVKSKDRATSEMNIYTTYKDNALKQKVVQQIRITSPDYKTIEGISTESSFGEIRRAFPNIKTVGTFDNTDTKIQTTIYDDMASGIAFEVGNPFGKTRCSAIIIHQKGRKVTDEYIYLNPHMIVL